MQPNTTINKYRTIFLCLAGAAIVGLVMNLLSIYPKKSKNSTAPIVAASPSQKACHRDTKLCPDGSQVRQSGPDCAFDKCPETTEELNMSIKTFTFPSGISFQYPDSVVVRENKRDQSLYSVVMEDIDGTSIEIYPQMPTVELAEGEELYQVPLLSNDEQIRINGQFVMKNYILDHGAKKEEIGDYFAVISYPMKETNVLMVKCNTFEENPLLCMRVIASISFENKPTIAD
jgi:hypothetical protein